MSSSEKRKTPLDSHLEFVRKMRSWLISSLVRAKDECKHGDVECLARVMEEEGEKILEDKDRK